MIQTGCNGTMYSVDGKELGKYVVSISREIQLVSAQKTVRGLVLDDVILWEDTLEEIPGTKVLVRYDEQGSARSLMTCFGAGTEEELHLLVSGSPKSTRMSVVPDQRTYFTLITAVLNLAVAGEGGSSTGGLVLEFNAPVRCDTVKWSSMRFNVTFVYGLSSPNIVDAAFFPEPVTPPFCEGRFVHFSNLPNELLSLLGVLPMGYSKYTENVIKQTKGASGSNSGCSDGRPDDYVRPTGRVNDCLWSDTYCTAGDQFGQCGIWVEDVVEKCGAWKECGGVVCRDDYQAGGKKFCLARFGIGLGADSTMTAYKKMSVETRAVKWSDTRAALPQGFLLDVLIYPSWGTGAVINTTSSSSSSSSTSSPSSSSSAASADTSSSKGGRRLLMADSGGAQALEGQQCSTQWTDCNGCTSTGDYCGTPSGQNSKSTKVVCDISSCPKDDGGGDNDDNGDKDDNFVRRATLLPTRPAQKRSLDVSKDTREFQDLVSAVLRLGSRSDSDAKAPTSTLELTFAHPIITPISNIGFRRLTFHYLPRACAFPFYYEGRRHDRCASQAKPPTPLPLPAGCTGYDYASSTNSKKDDSDNWDSPQCLSKMSGTWTPNGKFFFFFQ